MRLTNLLSVRVSKDGFCITPALIINLQRSCTDEVIKFLSRSFEVKVILLCISVPEDGPW